MTEVIIALFSHRVVKERFCISSMEHTETNLPDRFWKFLGFVEIERLNPIMNILNGSIYPLEISPEMFDAIPSLNKIIQLTKSNSQLKKNYEPTK